MYTDLDHKRTFETREQLVEWVKNNVQDDELADYIDFYYLVSMIRKGYVEALRVIDTAIDDYIDWNFEEI